MVVKSQITGAVNDYLRTVSGITIKKYPETEIIEYESSARNFVLDTAESLSSKSIKGLKKAERKFNVDDYATRDTVTVALEGRENNTRIGFSALVGLAQYLTDNNVESFVGYEGLAINHIDMTGNRRQRGFVNNRLYNLELCSDTQNSIHRVCMDRLQKDVYPGQYFGISALDGELIEKIRNNDIDDIKKYMDSIADTAEIDKHGTIYIGQAGLKLRQWKEYWMSQKLNLELKKVRA